MKLTPQTKLLLAALAKGQRLAVYIVENQTSAQFRYRCANPSAATEASSSWQAVYYEKSELSEVEKVLDRIDLIIIERQTAKDNLLLDFIRLAHSRGKKVLFDLDDLIFDYRDLPTLMRATSSKNIFYWLAYFFAIRRIARRVDGFLATNDFLAKKLKRSFKKPVAVIPNSLNSDQLTVSAELLLKKSEKSTFTLGYFSGSPTHQRDFALILPTLLDFLSAHSDARLLIVGYMRLPRSARSLLAAKRIIQKPPTDYLKLQKHIASADLNLAPLVKSDFADCKSELKFFESAIVEVPTLASPTYAFRHAIKSGETGFLCSDAKAWRNTLELLYSDQKLRHSVAKKAKSYCLKTYYGKTFLKQIEEAYDFFKK
ncbi:glycosyltransferase [Candidatus Saccharibacteria bacterium]|nr:glycosyltransferase [Candidatus Saccharibacteria bacterium]